jgi:5'-deoxynucleotidase YfbR-like HD superfamily hydrolase
MNFERTNIVLFLNRLTQLDLYDLWLYVSENNPSEGAPYHNTSHMLYMAWLADEFFQAHSSEAQSTCNERAMIVAALFHDFDHSGGNEPDSVNIDRAVAAWHTAYEKLQPKYMDPRLVEMFIRVTQYPYVGEAKTLEAKCLRDADLLYTTVMGNPHIVLRDLKAELEIQLKKEITKEEAAESYKEFIRKAELNTEIGKIIRLQCFPAFTLSLAMQCTGVKPISPAFAKEWLKG